MSYKRREAQSSEASNQNIVNQMRNIVIKVHQEIQKLQETQEREIIMSRSHTPIMTPDITLPTSTEKQQSRRSTPIVKLAIIESAQNSNKKLSSDKNNELSLKVFNNGYNAICAEFFPTNMWSKKLGLQLANNKYKNSRDILEWKQSREVKDNYNKLFTKSTTIENITSSAFLSLDDASDERFSDIYIYTASEAIDKNGQIKLSDSILILREKVPDISSKKKFTDDNEDENQPPEDEIMSNDISFKQYDKLFD
ncbi:16623_t:CDS:2 [Funneliformis geosporum]|uniref:5234_t:CDS:1 n=1 Tax=Funneliformis geosporum TaxID=1117311 RepID=A0A9W4T0B1_9GLOM|nr:16623_t:CDS:2 [Funneliformis geosporum]CAI2187963.1 5234_t:CDS:2 [Funneliformis geosporum]